MAETHRTDAPPCVNTYCPHCGSNASRMTLLGRAARLFCYCRPCDRMWWAA